MVQGLASRDAYHTMADVDEQKLMVYKARGDRLLTTGGREKVHGDKRFILPRARRRSHARLRHCGCVHVQLYTQGMSYSYDSNVSTATPPW